MYELRRRGGGEIAWMRTRSGFEVDFVVRGQQGPSLVQVCADPAGEARDRELRALDGAMAELGLAEATIVTMGHSEEVRVDGSRGTVRMVPAWEWLLRTS